MTSPGKAKLVSDLSAATFDSLLAKLDVDPAQAGLRYERLRERLMIFFLRRAVAAPEDLADEVIDRLARRVAEGEPIASIEGYALGIARLVLHEQNAARVRQAAGEYSLRNIFNREHTSIEEDRLLEDRIQAMEHCLSLLSAHEADLLSRYYLAEGKARIVTRTQLSESLRITPGALRKQVFRLCGRLRDCVGVRLSRIKSARDGKRP